MNRKSHKSESSNEITVIRVGGNGWGSGSKEKTSNPDLTNGSGILSLNLIRIQFLGWEQIRFLFLGGRFKSELYPPGSAHYHCK